MNKLDFTRTSQPQEIAQIDWSNPITRGLVSAILPYIKRDAVLQAFIPSSSGTTSTQATSSGFALTTAGLNSSIYTTATATQRVSEGTLLWLGDTYAAPSGSACLGGVTYDSSNSYPYVCIEFKRNPSGGEANTLGLTCSNGSMYAYNHQPMAGRLLIGVNRPGYQAFWVGRVGAVSLEQQNTFSGSLASTATSRIEVGGSLNSRSPDASCTVMALWNRALSDAEIRSVSQNPWQIFRPLTKQVWVPA